MSNREDMGDEVGYDLSQEEEGRAPGPVPGGHYLSCVSEISKHRNSNDTGNYVNIVWEILESGPQQGRKIFEWNVNVDHPSEMCQKIGRGRMKTIGLACGILTPRNYQEFVGQPLRLKVGVEKNTRQNADLYPEVNVALHCTPVQKGAAKGKSFDGSSLRDKIGAKGGDAGVPTARISAGGPAPTPQTLDDDDIPF